MQDISNGLEPSPIPLSLPKNGTLGLFETYITDSIFPDGTPIPSYKPVSSIEDDDNDVAGYSDTSSSSTPSSRESIDDEEEEAWSCTCSSSTDEEAEITINLCTVKDGETCDCVSGFGNFYSKPSIDKQEDQEGHDHQILNLDALPGNLPLVECSPQCPCFARCANKLTQRGVCIQVTVQLSSSGIGLGLFYTPSNDWVLSKGNFVCLYAGEYLTTPEAHQRWKNDRSTAMKEGEGNYILSLRLSNAQEIWHIDPRYKGNIGRFLNHSCDPNCIIQIVRWGVDSLPRAAIFAKRDIKRGEELTFDYANASGSLNFKQISEKEDTNKEDEDGSGRTRCLCGSAHCRGWMPFDETL